MAGQTDTTPTPKQTARAVMLDELRTSIIATVDALVAEKWQDITKAMDAQALADASEGGAEDGEPTKFRLSIGAAIVCLGTAATHEVSVAWSVRHKSVAESKRVAADDPRRPRLPGVGE